MRWEQSEQSAAASEQQNQQQSAPQRGDGARDDGDHMEQATQMRIAGQHGSASQRKPYDQCDSQAHNDQRKGDTDTFRHLGRDGTPTDHGCSEIAVQQIKYPIRVLRRIRTVKSELRAQRGDAFGRRLRSRNHRGNVAGKDTQCEKHQKRKTGQGRDEQPQPLDDEFHYR